MSFLKKFHRGEEGSVSFETVAIMGVAVLLLLIFQKYGSEALENVNVNIQSLLSIGG